MLHDFDKYRHHVDGFDLSENQKTDLLRSVWMMMEGFVDRSFGDDPVQRRQGAVSSKDASMNGPVIDLEPIENLQTENNLSRSFGLAAGKPGRRKRKS